jgi:Flp pilus assembly CpaF family ATPase
MHRASQCTVSGLLYPYRRWPYRRVPFIRLSGEYLARYGFVIGEKGSAKTSQIETLIPEIGPNYRIISYQDTEELHLEEFIRHGYKLENVRISEPEHLQKQIDALLYAWFRKDKLLF